jgi:hypothetical protein
VLHFLVSLIFNILSLYLHLSHTQHLLVCRLNMLCPPCLARLPLCSDMVVYACCSCGVPLMTRQYAPSPADIYLPATLFVSVFTPFLVRRHTRLAPASASCSFRVVAALLFRRCHYESLFLSYSTLVSNNYAYLFKSRWRCNWIVSILRVG